MVSLTCGSDIILALTSSSATGVTAARRRQLRLARWRRPAHDSSFYVAVAAASAAVAAAAAVVSPTAAVTSVSTNVYRLSTIVTF